ncbi:MAG: hypothetical protein IPL55_01515 [Saprospiraceae bacterium]|nr:hypothetical protein [Saprospiraceae bacterium]
MLSLKDFKEYEIKNDNLKSILGGIECSSLDGVIATVEEQNPDQADAIWDQLANGGIQCTRGGNILNITVKDGIARYEVIY